MLKWWASDSWQIHNLTRNKDIQHIPILKSTETLIEPQNDQHRDFWQTQNHTIQRDLAASKLDHHRQPFQTIKLTRAEPKMQNSNMTRTENLGTPNTRRDTSADPKPKQRGHHTDYKCDWQQRTQQNPNLFSTETPDWSQVDHYRKHPLTSNLTNKKTLGRNFTWQAQELLQTWNLAKKKPTACIWPDKHNKEQFINLMRSTSSANLQTHQPDTPKHS